MLLFHVLNRLNCRIVSPASIAQVAALTALCLDTGRVDAYVPAPQPVTMSNDYLVGANYFPGWQEGTHLGWEKISPYPQRTPMLGYYNEGSPEVADWEIKWAVEHGINYFNYCWYRGATDTPVTSTNQYLSAALNDGMLDAVYRNQFHFTVMFENTGGCNVSSQSDLMNNVMPYWINTYFKTPSYLKVDNKPVLYIYSPNTFISDLGGTAGAQAAITAMKSAVQQAGFPGLYVIGMYNTTSTTELQNLKDAGFDANSAYGLPSSGSPSAATAINQQLGVINSWKNSNILPFVPVASMGLDARPWASSWPGTPQNPATMSHYQLTPSDYGTLLANEKAVMDSMPQGSLSSKMILLDNWNEWGEGHYIAPAQQYGFGYLNAVRSTFTAKDNTPDERSPQQQGFGPYDSLYRNYWSSGDSQGFLYKDTFARTGNLEGTKSDVTAGYQTWWTANTNWTTDGSKLNKSVGSGNALLPFTPASNRIYTLSADIQVTGSDPSQYIALGFTNGDDAFNSWGSVENAVAWWRKKCGAYQLQTFLGPNMGGSSGQSLTGAAGFDTFTVVLDTTGAQWKAMWYLNGELERTQYFTTNPTISWVGLGGSAAGSIANFSLLVVPEPSLLVLLISGALLLGIRFYRF